jgi:tRNA (guanine37-N1)-methyltransferase
VFRFDILTTFPELFDPALPGGVLNSSIPARARQAGLVTWHATNIRDHTRDKHNKTDDRPFGGGPGMVMMCQPVWDAVHAVEALDERPARRILLTPQGRPLTQPMVEDLARDPDGRVLLIAGHYEGIDERVIRALEPLEISIGDYVLSGGELGAMVLMDAVIRLLPGALGDDDSAGQDSFSLTKGTLGKGKSAQHIAARLLDCPHYTRPREWMGQGVPDVLLSGDHEKIAAWRLQQRLERSRARRPDVLRETDLQGELHGDGHPHAAHAEVDDEVLRLAALGGAGGDDAIRDAGRAAEVSGLRKQVKGAEPCSTLSLTENVSAVPRTAYGHPAFHAVRKSKTSWTETTLSPFTSAHGSAASHAASPARSP